ncbi:MAG: choice-of-anchor C family protein [Desulfobaccales bacterium]
MKKLIILLALALPLIFAPAAGANLIVNGDFTSGPYPGSFTTLYPGDTNIAPWGIASGSVDYIGTYWSAPSGLSLDMNGLSQGSIAQTFATTNGQEYLVTFELAGNFDGPPNPKTLTVSVGGAPQTFSFSEPGSWSKPNNMGWTPESFTFTAGVGPSTTLTFTGDPTFDPTYGTTPYGPTLADVSVTAVPLPPSVLLLGSGLFGVGLLGRRKIFKG